MEEIMGLGGIIAKRCRVSLGNDEYIPKLIGVMVAQLCEHIKNY